MPTFQTHSIDDEPKVLIVGEKNELTRLVFDFYKQHQLEALFLDLASKGVMDQWQELVEGAELYKVVFICGFGELSLKKVEDLSRAADKKRLSQLYLLGLSTKIDSSSFLANSWKNEVRDEGQLLSSLAKSTTNRRLIVGQDVFCQASQLIPPLKFMFQADKNGLWFDPGQSLYLQPAAAFFESIKKELVKPGKNNYLIRGKKIKTSKFLRKFKQTYDSFYKSGRVIKKINTTRVAWLEKGYGLIEVAVDSDVEAIIEPLCRDLPGFNLSLDPHLLFKIKKSSGILKTPAEAAGLSAEMSKGSLDPKGDSAIGAFSNQTTSIAGSSIPLEEAGVGQQVPKETPDFDRGVSKTLGPADLAKGGLENSVEKYTAAEASFAASSEGGVGKTNAPDEKNSEDRQMDEEIGRLFSQERTALKTQRRTQAAGVLSTMRKKSKRKRAVFWLGVGAAAVAVLLGVGFGSFVLNFKRSERLLLSNLTSLQDGDYQELHATAALERQAKVVGSMIDIALIDRAYILIRLNDKLTSAAELAEQSELVGQRIFNYVVTGEDSGQKPVALSGLREVQEAGSGKEVLKNLIDQKAKIDQSLYQELSLLQAELGSRELIYLNQDLQKELSQAAPKLEKLKKQVDISRSLTPHLEELLGFNEEKLYFVVIQDNRELRPTGGFLHALIMLILRDGAIAEQRVIGVNEVDAKVMGRLNPPAEVVAFLGEDRLYLRDANWSPDFSQAAASINWFISEALSQNADGIFAADYNLMQSVLEKTGGVLVAGYDEVVEVKNLYDKLSYYDSEEKDQMLESGFKVSLWSSFLKELKNLDPQQQRDFLKTLSESFEQHHALAYYPGSSEGQIFGQLGWSGEMIQPECPPEFSDNCFVDQVFQVEANIGVNKINQYISRQTAHRIQITNESIIHERRLELSNKARSSIWPLGSYKTYLRFYVTPESQVDSVLIDDQPISQEKIIEYLDHNRRVFAFALEIEPQSSSKIVLNYAVPKQIQKGDSYFFFSQAQPGVENQALVTTIAYPDSLEAALVTPHVEYDQNQIISTNESGHAFLVVYFGEQ